MRYTLRYTSDLLPIRQANKLSELICESDYKVHIINNQTREIVWQNAESVRYGKKGVAKK